jgi:hypothetical protein
LRLTSFAIDITNTSFPRISMLAGLNESHVSVLKRDLKDRIRAAKKDVAGKQRFHGKFLYFLHGNFAFSYISILYILPLQIIYKDSGEPWYITVKACSQRYSSSVAPSQVPYDCSPDKDYPVQVFRNPFKKLPPRQGDDADFLPMNKKQKMDI